MKKAREKLDALPQNPSLRRRRSSRQPGSPLTNKSQKQALKKHSQYLYRFANDIILLTDEEWNILEANERAVRTYGYDREALLKMHLRDLRVPAERDKLAAEYRQTEERSGSIFETVHLKKDGSSFPVEVSARVIAVDDNTYYQNIIRDISERKDAAAKLLAASRLYAFLSQVDQAIVHASDREKLFQDICNIAVEFGKTRMAWIGLIDHKTRTVRPAFQAGHVAGYLDHLTVAVDDLPMGRGPTGTAVRENRLVICNDFRQDERMAPWREEAISRGYLSSAALPIRVQGKSIGALMLYSGEAGFFNASQVDLLEEITGEIAHALDALEKENQRLAAEKALRSASLYNRRLVEANLDPLVTIGPDGKITDVNEATEIVTGVGRERLIGDDFTNYFTAPELAKRGYQRTLAEGLLRDYPLVIRHVSGKETPVLYNATVYKNESGEVQGVFAAARDVSETKLAEAKLREQLAELQRWHNLTLAREGRILDLKHEVNELLGKIGQTPRYASAEILAGKEE